MSQMKLSEPDPTGSGDRERKRQSETIWRAINFFGEPSSTKGDSNMRKNLCCSAFKMLLKILNICAKKNRQKCAGIWVKNFSH